MIDKEDKESANTNRGNLTVKSGTGMDIQSLINICTKKL